MLIAIHTIPLTITLRLRYHRLHSMHLAANSSAFNVFTCQQNTEVFVHVPVISRMCENCCPGVLHGMPSTDNQTSESSHVREQLHPK